MTELADTAPVVVITGASAGVGRATALAFAAEGCRIGLIARDRHRLQAAKAEVEAAGGEALVLPADVADPAALEAAADQVERALGPIDVWVNVAMATVFARFGDVTPDEYRRVTEVTYLGQVYGTMAALRRMRARGRGRIVNVGSALAYHGLPLQAAYCGAKFAIRGFVEAVRAELIHEQSRVSLSMIILPAVNTPQFDWARNKLPGRPQPAPPIYQPEVAARAILRAARTGAREICVGTSSFQVLLGSLLAPGLLDRRLAAIGYRAQQTDQPARADRPDNLFTPVPGDFGAHGRFDREASSQALATSVRTARLALAGFGTALLLAALIAARRLGRPARAR